MQKEIIYIISKRLVQFEIFLAAIWSWSARRRLLYLSLKENRKRLTTSKSTGRPKGELFRCLSRNLSKLKSRLQGYLRGEKTKPPGLNPRQQAAKTANSSIHDRKKPTESRWTRVTIKTPLKPVPLTVAMSDAEAVKTRKAAAAAVLAAFKDQVSTIATSWSKAACRLRSKQSMTSSRIK